MASERFQRRINRILDQIEDAADLRDWKMVVQLSEDTCRQSGNTNAQQYLEAANRNLGSGPEPHVDESVEPTQRPVLPVSSDPPTSFANGR